MFDIELELELFFSKFRICTNLEKKILEFLKKLLFDIEIRSTLELELFSKWPYQDQLHFALLEACIS